MSWWLLRYSSFRLAHDFLWSKETRLQRPPSAKSNWKNNEKSDMKDRGYNTELRHLVLNLTSLKKHQMGLDEPQEWCFWSHTFPRWTLLCIGIELSMKKKFYVPPKSRPTVQYHIACSPKFQFALRIGYHPATWEVKDQGLNHSRSMLRFLELQTKYYVLRLERHERDGFEGFLIFNDLSQRLRGSAFESSPPGGMKMTMGKDLTQSLLSAKRMVWYSNIMLSSWSGIFISSPATSESGSVLLPQAPVAKLLRQPSNGKTRRLQSLVGQETWYVERSKYSIQARIQTRDRHGRFCVAVSSRQPRSEQRLKDVLMFPKGQTSGEALPAVFFNHAKASSAVQSVATSSKTIAYLTAYLRSYANRAYKAPMEDS